LAVRFNVQHDRAHIKNGGPQFKFGASAPCPASDPEDQSICVMFNSAAIDEGSVSPTERAVSVAPLERD
jgi:hypothetical protein